MASYAPSETSADKQEKKQPKLTAERKSAILKEARARYDRAMERERDNITLAYEDLEFLAGKQWPADLVKVREGESRPVLTINQMPQFVHQVTGDIRQMRPAIKVVGIDDQADRKLADLREGLTRYIENRSDAPAIYFQAADSQVACGIGHARVCTEYADDTTHEQEIRIDGVDDGVSVLWDPDAKRITREDAMFCFVPVDMTQDSFKEKYPDASMAEMEDVKSWNNYSDWNHDNVVRVAEYWVKQPKKLILAFTPQGETIDCTEDDEQYTAAEKLRLCEANGAIIEERESYEVCRYLITATDVLEGPEPWAGRYIPIVPFVGEEIRIGRKTVRRGIIREAKGAQQQYNYFTSAHTEVVALQPKAPFLVTETNVAKYQGMWEQANSKNFPYLLYSPDTKNGNAPPQRVQPAVSSDGITDGLMLANENMRRIIGIYDASLGAKSNETSGVAIQRRDAQGDTGTVVYRDNFARAVRQVGKIVIDLIPHVYDTQRTIRIMGEDGKVDIMEINQERDKSGMPILDEQGNPVILHDMTIGAYDVMAEAGNSYATKRQESSENMLAFLQTMPDTAPLVGDLVAKVQDWPMADKFAERLHAALPPQILAAEKAAEAEESGQPPQVDPAEQMAQQAQQEQMQAGMAEMSAKVAEAEARAEQAKANAEKAIADAETARINTQIAEAELAAKGVAIVKDIDAHETDKARSGERHEFELNRDMDDHFVALEQADQSAAQGAEKHKVQIQRMKEPPARPSA